MKLFEPHYYFSQIRSKFLSWLFVMVWMGSIFLMSSQPGNNQPISVAYFLVRKGAHVFEYFVLSMFVFNALRLSFPQKPKTFLALWSFILTVSYACTDEFHQTTVPGRAGKLSDVGIDTIGTLLGIFYFFKNYEKIQTSK